MKIIIYLIFSLLLSNLALAETSPNVLTLAPNNFAVLPIEIAPQVLKQCSRDTPQVDSFWIPKQAEIIQLEGQLIDFLNQKKKATYNTPYPQAYDRQFIGIIQNGEKLIYGNFFPFKYSKTFHRLAEIIDVCDGFGSFWGVIYNPNTQQFSELRINGLAEKTH